MNIDQVAKYFNITKSKLRYYEKNGIIKEIERDQNGNRIYTDQDLVWIEFFLNLKETDMTLKEIQYYISLKKFGEDTIEERKNILLNQVDSIDDRVEELLKIKSNILDQVEEYDKNKGNCIIKSKSEKKC